MSVLIKGIDIPTYLNEDCVVVIRKDGKADVWQTGVKERTVEAIQIPTPHGRLIDEKEVILHHYETVDREVEHPKYQITPREMLDDAPTILEAEE